MPPSLHLLIVAGDEAPIYRQIMRQVREAVACGRIRAGEQLPSHRDLARSLVIAPLTVKKAYDELERDGVVETLRGQGTFIAAQRKTPDEVEGQIEPLRPLVTRLVQDAHLTGVTVTSLVRLIREEAARLKQERIALDTEEEP